MDGEGATRGSPFPLRFFFPPSFLPLLIRSIFRAPSDTWPFWRVIATGNRALAPVTFHCK